jgi:hypothetical protein
MTRTVIADDSRNEFWSANETLARIKSAAELRSVGRWALLASCLARVATLVPVDTTLPPTVGSRASLNCYACLVSDSSGGKSAAQAVAHDLLPIPDVPILPLGTGQGMVASFVTYIAAKPGNKEGTPATPAHLERVNSAVLFKVDEIGDITAKTANGGNNLMPALRSAWGAEEQGSSTVSKDSRLHLNRHSYRAALIINAQLGASRFLLNDSDAGTPQRFLWAPAVDGSDLTEDQILSMTWEDLAPSGEAVRPIDVSHLPFSFYADLESPSWYHDLKVCRAAAIDVRLDRKRAEAGLPTKFPAHHLLNRLKVAALLSFLCGGNGDVTDEYWDLSAVVMGVSEETKVMLAAHAEMADAEEDAKAGARFGRIEDAKQDMLADAEDKRAARIRDRIIKRLADGPMRLREIRQGFNGKDKKAAIEALTLLVNSQQVLLRDDETYALAEGE